MKTLIVITLYNCYLEESRTWQDICTKFECDDTILIFDNTPSKDSHNRSAVGALGSNIIYQGDAVNHGIHGAYIAAFDYCKQYKIPWMIFFDQDTIVPDNYFSIFRLEMIKHIGTKSVIVPEVMTTNNKLISPFDYNEFIFHRKSKKVNSAINSGLCLSMSHCSISELLTGNFFVDFVDYELFFNLQHQGYRIISLDDVQLQQNLSLTNLRTMSIERYQSFCQSELQFILQYLRHEKKRLFLCLILRIIKLTITGNLSKIIPVVGELVGVVQGKSHRMKLKEL